MITQRIGRTKIKGLTGHDQIKEIAENNPDNPDTGRSVHQSFPEGFFGEFTPFTGEQIGEVEETSHFYCTENHPQHIHTATKEDEGNCQECDKI